MRCTKLDARSGSARRSLLMFAMSPSRWLLLIFMLFGASPADAEAGHLLQRLTPEVMAVVWPGAEKLGPEEGKPSAIPVYRGGNVVGYLFSTLDTVNAQGFSVIPFDVIGGVDL